MNLHNIIFNQNIFKNISHQQGSNNIKPKK